MAAVVGTGMAAVVGTGVAAVMGTGMGGVPVPAPCTMYHYPGTPPTSVPLSIAAGYSQHQSLATGGVHQAMFFK